MTKKSTPEETPTVEFHYIKSNFFRVIHADGAYGGVTARGYLHVAFYNERRAIPRSTEMVLDMDADAATETPKDVRSGVVREVEADIMLDEDATISLINWLQGKLVDLQKVKEMKRQVESDGA